MNPDVLQTGLFVALFIWLIKHTMDVTKIGAQLTQAVRDISRRLDKIECAVEKVSRTVQHHDPVIDGLKDRVEHVETYVLPRAARLEAKRNGQEKEKVE